MDGQRGLLESVGKNGGTIYSNGDGYWYRIKKKTNYSWRLSCHKDSCRGSGKILLNRPHRHLVQVEAHSCLANNYFSAVTELRHKIMERAMNEITPLRCIFLEETTRSDVIPEIAAKLSFAKMESAMFKARRKNGIPVVPTTIVGPDDICSITEQNNHNQFNRNNHTSLQQYGKEGTKTYTSQSSLFIMDGERCLLESVGKNGGAIYSNGDGYWYRIKKKNHHSWMLSCHKDSCRGSGKILLNKPYRHLVQVEAHSCLANNDFSAVTELRHKIMERAVNEITPLRRIFLEETTRSDVIPEIAAQLSFAKMESAMLKARRKEGIPVVPTTIEGSDDTPVVYIELN